MKSGLVELATLKSRAWSMITWSCNFHHKPNQCSSLRGEEKTNYEKNTFLVNTQNRTQNYASCTQCSINAPLRA